MLYQIYIFLFLLFSLSCVQSEDHLKCTQCRFTYSFTQSFSVPDNCPLIDATDTGCYVSLDFSFDQQQYTVNFGKKAGVEPTGSKNLSVSLTFYQSGLFKFYYSIQYRCSYRDDCTRDLAKYEVAQLLKRQINYTAIITETRPLVLGPPLTPGNPSLSCYNGVRPGTCAASPTLSGICAILDNMWDKTTRITCDYYTLYLGPRIKIYQSFERNITTFNIYCTQQLCNTNRTLQTVKGIMFKYGVTTTPDGLLNDSQLIISTSFLMIVMLLFVIFNSE